MKLWNYNRLMLQYSNFILPSKLLKTNVGYMYKCKFIVTREDSSEHLDYRFISDTIQKWKYHLVDFPSEHYESSTSKN